MSTGAAPTPILSDIQALDATFLGTTPRLTHCNGDFYSADGYTPEQTALPAGTAPAHTDVARVVQVGAYRALRLRRHVLQPYRVGRDRRCLGIREERLQQRIARGMVNRMGMGGARCEHGSLRCGSGGNAQPMRGAMPRGVM